MQINTPATAPAYGAGNLREGNLDSKVLLRGREGALNNYRLSFETAQESWSTPRHRHNFDQIRFPLAGVVEYGKDLPTLPVGVVAYFPESIHYGPQVRHDQSVTLTLQFGGASENGFMSPEERKRGFEELKRKGEFANGVFSWYDANGQVHRRDAYQAVWEHIRGRKLEYARPRYNGHIVMDPQNFTWVPEGAQPGVRRKWLGTFTERALNLAMIQIEAGARWRLDPYPAPQILIVASGAVQHAGTAYGVHAAFGLEDDEGPVSFESAQGCELYFVQLPVFGQARAKAAA